MLNKQNYFLFIIIIIILSKNVIAQDDAFTNEVTTTNEKVYYNGNLLTGWLFSAEDGIPNDCDCILKAKYKKGVLNGSKKRWFTNGKLKESSKYANGALTQKSLYYSNGSLKKKEKYSNGTIISSILYNKDGTIKSQSGATPIQTKTKINSENKINTENTISYNDDTQDIISTEDGIFKIYHPEGNLFRITFHKNGLLVKDSIFHTNGILKLVKKYADGELIHTEEYTENNDLIKEQNFLNNKKNGVQVENFTDGQPKLITHYNNGVLTHSETYLENGFQAIEENFKFKKKHGVQKQYNIKGKLISLQEYNMGILFKNEKYTPEGKEIININNELAEIKTYNAKNQLLNLKYEHVKTKEKDSLWIIFNPSTGFKKHEEAYKNGLKIREGSYQNNKKNGTWKYYWEDGKKMTIKLFKNGNEIESKTITYSKQIKNNFKSGDLLYSYLVPNPKAKNNYILLRFSEDDDEHSPQIKKAIINICNKSFKSIANANGIDDIELYSIIKLSALKTKFIAKKPGSKKQVAYINSEISITNMTNLKEFTKVIAVSPINEKHTNINSFFTKNMEEAFQETLLNLNLKIKDLLQNKFPLKGSIVRVISQTTKEINEVSVYFETSSQLFEKDILIVLDNQKKQKAKLKVVSVDMHIAICKVKEGGKWLKSYYKLNKNPIVQKIYNDN